MKNNQIHRVYFVGIGGIGMSALARYYNDHGVQVFGYDKTSTELTNNLEQEGMKIQYVDDTSILPKEIDLVVYTPAIPTSNQILSHFKQSEIPVLKRAQALGEIVNSGECYAVAGSHGKSTTSAMLAHLFQVSGKNCTGFLGAVSTNYESNYIKGCEECFVVEADEFDRSFHQIKASSTIITSVDSDHLDIYGTIEGIQEAFLTYVDGIRPNGVVVIQADQEIIPRIQNHNIITYSAFGKAMVQAVHVRNQQGKFLFDVQTTDTTIQDISLQMGGMYNVENACGVIALALHYGIDEQSIIEAFSSFRGLKRRFEYIINTPDFVFIDDYAHHPHEIRSFLQALRNSAPNKRIAVIFQPHLYSRTKDYYPHFAESLDLADEVLLLDIYPAREEPIPGVSSQLIQDEMKNENVQLVTFETVNEAVNQLENIDVLATVGAGNISLLIPKLKQHLEQ